VTTLARHIWWQQGTRHCRVSCQSLWYSQHDHRSHTGKCSARSSDHLSKLPATSTSVARSSVILQIAEDLTLRRVFPHNEPSYLLKRQSVEQASHSTLVAHLQVLCVIWCAGKAPCPVPPVRAFLCVPYCGLLASFTVRGASWRSCLERSSSAGASPRR
jgi:hypothetical protein